LDKWNTKSLTDMANMFADAKSFNQNINTWDISNVRDLTAVFWGATSFN
jgi:surface protein